jgi:hypothetical protein
MCSKPPAGKTKEFPELNRGKRDDAYELRKILASSRPVYEWFSEGFESADLCDARVFLDALN